MPQITLRGLDPEVEHAIRRKAQKTGKSLNRVVLEMIYFYTGSRKTGNGPPGDSLQKLAGGWVEADAEEFFESIKLCDQIDESMWE